MLTGTIAGQAISVLLVPVSTRIYGVTEYGNLALFISTATLVVGFMGFGLQSAIMVADTDDEAKDLYKIAIHGSGVILSIVYGVCAISAPWFKICNVEMNYYLLLFLLFIHSYVLNATNMTYAWLNRLGKYNVLLVNPILTPLINNGLLIILGLNGYKNAGLYVGTIISQVLTLLHMQRHKGSMKTHMTVQSSKDLLKKNRDFIVFQYPSSLMNSIANQLPVQILSMFFGKSVVGYYSMTQRLLNIPISLIGGSITRVYFKDAAERQRTSGDARKFTFKIAKTIMLLYCIPTVIIMAFGDTLVPLLLGSNWEGCGPYIQIMIVWNMFFLLVHCFGGFPSIIGMQKRDMMNAMVTLVTDAIVLYGFSAVWHNPLISLVCFALLHVFMHIWFYNDMFSIDPDLKNRYAKLSIGTLVSVCAISIGIKFIISWL